MDPVSFIASLVTSVAIAGITAKGTGDIARRDARTSVQIARMEAAHVRELQESWQLLTTRVIPVFAGMGVFLAFAMAQGKGPGR